MELSELYLEAGSVDSALSLLKDKARESLLIAKACKAKGELETSERFYVEAWSKDPNSLSAIKGLLKCYFRQCKHESCIRLIHNFEHKLIERGASASCNQLNYLKGLFLSWAGNTGKSLFYLNLVRKDSQFGTKALVKMIELYAGLETINQLEDKGKNESKNCEVLADRLRTAKHLLEELKLSRTKRELSAPIIKIATCYCLLLMRNRTEIQEALEILIEVIQEYEAEPKGFSKRDFGLSLYLLSVCLSLLDEHAKARNQLKRLLKLHGTTYMSTVTENGAVLLSSLYK